MFLTIFKLIWIALAFSSVTYALFSPEVGEALISSPSNSLAHADVAYTFLFENGFSPRAIHLLKTAVWALFVVIPFLWVAQVVYSPMDYHRNVEEVGYLPEKKKHIK